VTAAVGGVLLAGCSSEPESAPRAEAPGPDTFVGHCAKVVRVDAEAEVTELQGDGLTLPAADFVADSPSGTVLVLLHQVGPEGMCGWAAFAPQAAAAGLSSVAVDMCGYAAATCAETTPPEDQVALAVAHARDELDAQRVVLVGASMGGSQTVISVARGADVDGWVDLSGPDVWDHTKLRDLVAEVTARGLPGLVAHAPDDNARQYRASMALAEATGAQFLSGESGHGWDLLDDREGVLRADGQTVIDFLTSIASQG
jgi:pimeloyl-ACP methyl ester carboxylesterase